MLNDTQDLTREISQLNDSIYYLKRSLFHQTKILVRLANRDVLSRILSTLKECDIRKSVLEQNDREEKLQKEITAVNFLTIDKGEKETLKRCLQNCLNENENEKRIAHTVAIDKVTMVANDEAEKILSELKGFDDL